MSKKIIKEICYKTTDNTSFSSKKEAGHHQKKFDFMENIKDLIPAAQKIFNETDPKILIGKIINEYSWDVGNFEELLKYLVITYLEVPEILTFLKFVEKQFNEYKQS